MALAAERRLRDGITIYSEKVPGSEGNYGWDSRFDLTDGYLGIDSDTGEGDRVLLSPRQVKALLAFLANR